MKRGRKPRTFFQANLRAASGCSNCQYVTTTVRSLEPERLSYSCNLFVNGFGDNDNDVKPFSVCDYYKKEEKV